MERWERDAHIKASVDEEHSDALNGTKASPLTGCHPHKPTNLLRRQE